MNTPPGVPLVLRPVALDAPLRRMSGLIYSEVDGQPVVCDVADQTIHVLSARMALLWSVLDGRPLGQVITDEALLGATAAATEHEAGVLAVIEGARRAKALGLAEDVPTAEQGDRLPPVGNGSGVTAKVTLVAHRRVAAGGVELLFAAANDAGADDPSGHRHEYVEVDLRDGYPSVDAAPIDRIRLPPGTGGSPNGPAVAALTLLVQRLVTPGVLADAGVFDGLASLAELVDPGDIDGP